MTVAQTFAIVNNLLDNTKVVMDGGCITNSRYLMLIVRIGGDVSTSAIRQTLGKFCDLPALSVAWPHERC